MPGWLPDIEYDAEAVTRAIDAQFPELQAGVRGVTRIGAGWDNAVWRIGAADELEPMAFRFTQRHIAVDLAQRELAVMPLVAPLLPLPTSAPTHVGRTTIDVPLPWFAYRLLPGDEAIVVDLEPHAQERFARQLGEFLRVLHQPGILAVVDATGLVVRDQNRRAEIGSVVERGRAALDDMVRAGYALTSAQRAAVERIFDVAAAATLPNGDVFLHGDLHVRHILVAADGDITGVIDWGDMTTGPRALDLVAYWALLDPAARPAFLASYGAIDDGSLAHARALAVMLTVMIAASASDMGRRDVADRSCAALDRITTG